MCEFPIPDNYEKWNNFVKIDRQVYRNEAYADQIEYSKHTYFPNGQR